MSFTSAEISEAGFSSLDYQIKNKPIDQIATEHPLLKKLQAKKKTFPGGKQYVTEQIRKSYDSNAQWYRGAGTVTYNERKTLRQTQWEWGSTHDGFFFDEDRLVQNGILLDDRQKPGNFSNAEAVQLTNIFTESTEALRLGFDENFDKDLHLDGTHQAEAIDGLDAIIQTATVASQIGSANVRGGLDSSVEADHLGRKYWHNQSALDVAKADLSEAMEKEWRRMGRNGGKPDFILAGSTFVDTYRAMAKTDIDVNINTSNGSTDFDVSVTGLSFHNVPIVWDPTFEQLDTDFSPAQEWESRCYFINTKHFKLRPMAGHDMKSRKPPRAHDKYVYYWGLTWKGVITANRLNCHGVITVTGL